MGKHTKIQVFLRSQGVTEQTEKEEIDRLKKEYWKKQRVLLNRSKRAATKEVRFGLSLDEWQVLEARAATKNMTVTEYAKAAIKGYEEAVYIRPNIAALDELVPAVRKIGVNINTAVQYMHLTRNYGETDAGLGRLREELNMLFRLLQESIEDRPELYRWLQSELESHPDRIKRVLHIIEKIQSDASSKEQGI